MNEFKVIVTTSGYAESSQMSHIIWRGANQVDQPEYDLKDPISAFKSLADDLFQDYLDNYRKCSGNKKCHKFKSSYRDRVFCGVCGERLRAPHEETYEFEDFNDYIRRLSSCTADSYGEGLDRWWPWDGLVLALDTPRENIIRVGESFESLAARVATSPYLTDEEQVLLKEYQTELYPIKAKYNESTKLMEIETDFDL